MPIDSPFRRLPDAQARTLAFTFAGRELEAREGDSLAAALLAVGIATTRHTPVSGAPRGPYCMIGQCFECLVEIDGVPNRQACMVEVQDGMRVQAMAGARELEKAPADD